jgi:hypothetical protein
MSDHLTIPYPHKLFNIAQRGGPFASGLHKWAQEQCERADLSVELETTRARIRRMETVYYEMKTVEECWRSVRNRFADYEGKSSPSIEYDLFKALVDDLRRRLREERRWRKWLIGELKDRPDESGRIGTWATGWPPLRNDHYKTTSVDIFNKLSELAKSTGGREETLMEGLSIWLEGRLECHDLHFEFEVAQERITQLEEVRNNIRAFPLKPDYLKMLAEDLCERVEEESRWLQWLTVELEKRQER